MYISMSYHYSKYEFVDSESDLERYSVQIQVSEFFEPIAVVLVCFDGIFRGHVPKAIPVETYQ